MIDLPSDILQELLPEIARRLEQQPVFLGHGYVDAWDEAVQLLLFVLDIDPQNEEAQLPERLTPQQYQQLLPLLQQRIEENKPLAYLINRAWFMQLPFYVDEQVLIPRSPFAELIQQRFSPWVNADAINNILEIGTGSGCMSIAAALQFPQANIDAVDISAEALLVAERNVHAYQLQSRVQLQHSDLFSALAAKQYDIIMSNPPYVGLSEWQALPAEYQHEPKMALVADQEGMALVVKILARAASFLTENGILVVEVGYSAEILKRLFPSVPFIWLEFEQGGEGVFLLSAEALKTHQALFEEKEKMSE